MKILESTLSAEEKMLLFEKGERKENVKACGDEKLKVYWDICIDNNFCRAGSSIETELCNRNLISQANRWFTSNINTANDTLSAADNDLLDKVCDVLKGQNSYKYLSELVADLLSIESGNKTIKTYMNLHQGRVNGFIAILVALVLNLSCAKDLGQAVNEVKNAWYGPYIPKAQFKQIAQAITADQPVMNELSALRNNYTPKTESLLHESIEKHDELNPKLWTNNDELRPVVKEKIFNIVIDFINGLKEDGIKFNLKDIVLVGSNCSYNYNNDSDLDIHLRLSTKNLVCPDNLYPLLYSAYRSLFNKKHDISFYDIPVEIFVETAFDQEEDTATEQKLNSAGVYSVLQDKWIKKPEPADIPEINQNEIDELVAPWAEKYLQIRYKPTVEAIDKYITDIYELRKTGIAVSEFDPRNLVFKEIRSRGYLDDLKNLKDKLTSRQYSLK